ncbi:MAG: twin-arginine translocase subunit TatC [Spirochaetales bacterium]|nr:twin-arginine translocase subunit TatC [Spirochaetales bacterium]MCF7938892.1 twin-arginine translocase subunit TatC [Spirochaetales bacterium]
MRSSVREEVRKPFLGHLDELRRKIFIAALVFFTTAGAAFYFSDILIAFLTGPIEGLDIQLHYFKPQEKFMTYIRVAAFAGLFAAIPFLLFQAARFVSPALHPHERKPLVLVLVSSFLLFLGGAYFSYAAIAPTALKFFVNFAGNDGVLPVWGMESYFRLLFGVILALGFSFQLPLILLFFLSIDFIDYDALRRGRRFAVLVAFIAGAVLTPPDVLTQLVVGISLYMLYEATLVVAAVMVRRRGRLADESL